MKFSFQKYLFLFYFSHAKCWSVVVDLLVTGSQQSGEITLIFWLTIRKNFMCSRVSMNSVKADDMFGDDNNLDLDEYSTTNSTYEPLATPEHVKGHKTINDHYSSFIGKLYKLESSVETLRENTMKIVEEKKNLLATLQTILDNDAPLTEGTYI